MDTSAVDFPALALMIAAAAAIVVAIAVGGRENNRRRRWLAALGVGLLLMVLTVLDLLRETPRETHLATAFIGIPLPVLGAMATERLTRRVRPWLRWPIVLAVTFALLLSGMLLGAAVAPRFLPS